jgi:hypothetical protein
MSTAPKTFDELRNSGRIPRALLSRHDAAAGRMRNIQPLTFDQEPELEDDAPEDPRAEVQRLREQNARLQGRLEAQPRQQQTEPQAPQRRTYVDLQGEDEALTDEEQAAYGEASSTIAKLSKREARRMLADVLPQINDRLAELDDKFSTVGESVVANTQQTFMERVNGAYPELSKLRSDPKFNAYLGAEPAEGLAGVTRRQIVQNAWNRQDFPTVQKIMEAYRRTVGGAPAQSPEQFTRPSGAQRQPVHVSPPAHGSGPKASEWASLRQQRMSNRVSQADYAAKEAVFKAAQKNGTLVDDIGYFTPKQTSDSSDRAS